MISGIGDNLAAATIGQVSAAPAQTAAIRDTAPALPTDSLVRAQSSDDGLMSPSMVKAQSSSTTQVATTEMVAEAEEVSSKSSNAYIDKWGPQVIYFPLTDRFNDGDPSNNMGCDKADPRGYHGGDLQGIIDKLDYLDDLGVTTLWLAPLYDNVDRAGDGVHDWGSGYHGYWIQDHYKVEEHQGDMGKVKELVGKAHEKGMKVVLDTVLNHTAPGHQWTQDPSKQDWFHHNGGIQNWENPWELANRDVCGLPDLNQSNPDTYKFLLDNTLWWIRETGADGIRLDAVKHIDHEFWQKFSADIKAEMGDDFMVLGEVLHGDPNVQASYQRDGLSSLFDMPLYYTMKETFAQDGSCRKLAARFGEDCKYDQPGQMVTLLDNHDFERFLESAKGYRSHDKLMLGMDMIMTCRGIPSIYYGTETGLEGANDPYNRGDMNFGENGHITDHLKKLTSTRAGLPALQTGSQMEMWVDDQIYGFCRRQDGQEVISIVNNDYSGQTRDIPLREGSPIQEGETLVDALTGEKFQVKNGRVNVYIPDKKGRILVPEKFMGDIKFKN